MTYVGKPIGVSNGTIFPLKTDVAGDAATYDVAKKLARLMQVQLSPQFAEGLLESDNTVEDEVALLQAIEVTIDASQLTDEIRAFALGHRLDSTGGLIVKPTDTPPLLAFAFKVLLSKQSGADKFAYIVLYKGRFREFEETFKTSTRGGVEYQTHSGIKGTFFARDSDGALMYRMREDSTGFSATKAAAWFTAPQEAAPQEP